jgi:hypothetical protein
MWERYIKREYLLLDGVLYDAVYKSTGTILIFREGESIYFNSHDGADFCGNMAGFIEDGVIKFEKGV